MSNGKDMIKDWDVILESKEWRLRVGVKNLIPPWVGATNNELSMNEKSWTVIKGPGHGHSPTEIQMLRLLSSLSAIYFRGGYYDGHEESWIDSIVLKEGDHHVERMQRKVHARHLCIDCHVSRSSRPMHFPPSAMPSIPTSFILCSRLSSFLSVEVCR
jgi:hypothetical protein